MMTLQGLPRLQRLSEPRNDEEAFFVFEFLFFPTRKGKQAGNLRPSQEKIKKKKSYSSLQGNPVKQIPTT